MMNDNELFELCKSVYEATGWDNKSNTPSKERLKVWQQGYSLSEMGEGHEDYDTTPPEERNKVNVYDWEIREDPRHRITTGQEVFKWWFSQVKTIENNVFPLYTSDYILSKLPITLQHDEHFDYLTVYCDNHDLWWATYELLNDCTKYDTKGTTPLKALLKLTLELHKKGLLDERK